jgi:hypothetical protein
MPLLQELVQPEEIHEAAQPYTPASNPSPEAGPRYRFEKRGRQSWAVPDSREGDALPALTKYKKARRPLSSVWKPMNAASPS